MCDVIDIKPLLRDCENCKYHVQYGCSVPGGWRASEDYSECLDFAYRHKPEVGDDL